jgi:hypothetical protein
LAKLKANVTAPYHHACSVCDEVKVPTSAGSTGMISPIDTMSMSTATMMKGIAAARSGATRAGGTLVIRRGSSALPS